MITADTNTWIAYLDGEQAPDTETLERALNEKQLLMVPAVLAELLSDTRLPDALAAAIVAIPLIEIQEGYWQRTGELRRHLLSKGSKVRLGDTLIAQSCIDNNIPLITRDRDFRGFAALAALVLS